MLTFKKENIGQYMFEVNIIESEHIDELKPILKRFYNSIQEFNADCIDNNIDISYCEISKKIKHGYSDTDTKLQLRELTKEFLSNYYVGE